MKTRTLAILCAGLPLAIKLGYMFIKFLTRIILSTSMLGLFACQRSSIFDAQPQTPLAHPLLGASGEVAMALEVYSRGQHVPRTLLIETNGFVRYIDSSAFAGQITSALAPQVYGEWVAQFLETDFLHLADRYESATTTAAQSFRISFKHGGAEKTLTTDSVGAPASVQNILQRFAQEIAAVRAQALTLVFTSSRDTLANGEDTQLQLLVTNAQPQPVAVRAGATLAEFLVLAPAQFAAAGNDFTTTAPRLWAESLHSNSNFALQSFTVQPGNHFVVSTQWNGRSTSGVLTEGNYLVAARLATIPGGISAPRVLYVKAQ